MVAGVLYYQSLPEIETDLAAGKHTLANKLGKDKAALVFKLWWPAVWLLLINLWACGLAGWPVFLGLSGLPFYLTACRRINAAGRMGQGGAGPAAAARKRITRPPRAWPRNWTP